jgi:hypothetical protein
VYRCEICNYQSKPGQSVHRHTVYRQGAAGNHDRLSFALRTMMDADKEELLHLLECTERHRASRPPPLPDRKRGEDGCTWGDRMRYWSDVERYGWRVVTLYGDGYDSSARMRTRRALARLEAAGLVELIRYDRNVTHCKLTREGETRPPAGRGGRGSGGPGGGVNGRAAPTRGGARRWRPGAPPIRPWGRG